MLEIESCNECDNFTHFKVDQKENTFYVICNVCGHKGIGSETTSGAIANWNAPTRSVGMETGILNFIEGR